MLNPDSGMLASVVPPLVAMLNPPAPDALPELATSRTPVIFTPAYPVSVSVTVSPASTASMYVVQSSSALDPAGALPPVTVTIG